MISTADSRDGFTSSSTFSRYLTLWGQEGLSIFSLELPDSPFREDLDSESERNHPRKIVRHRLVPSGVAHRGESPRIGRSKQFFLASDCS